MGDLLPCSTYRANGLWQSLFLHFDETKSTKFCRMNFLRQRRCKFLFLFPARNAIVFRLTAERGLAKLRLFASILAKPARFPVSVPACGTPKRSRARDIY